MSSVTSRKILCAVVLAAAGLTALPGGAGAQVRLQRAGLAQKGRELVLTVRTSEAVALSQLEARPDVRRAESRYICLSLSGSSGERLLCLGGAKAHKRIGVETVDAAGAPPRKDSVRAKVTRPQPDKLVVALDPKLAGLTPHRYRWRVIASAGCDPGNRCAESLPATGTNSFRLRPVRAVGCTGGEPGLVTNGPRERKVVALTFDDGPSEYTDDFLAVLRDKDVRATFFQIGQEMPGREEVMRQILDAGSELADHTMNHVEFPGFDQIAGAASQIESYTHFRPCLFRPPGGAFNADVLATAGSLGMRTINWDVDPRDWALPGADAIYSHIVSHTRNGSIVLMHDGGGPRDQTLAALPRIIDTLRARGYRFATVTELLGDRVLYRPYG